MPSKRYVIVERKGGEISNGSEHSSHDFMNLFNASTLKLSNKDKSALSFMKHEESS